MQIDIGNRKIDTSEVVEAFIDTQEIKDIGQVMLMILTFLCYTGFGYSQQMKL